MPIDCDLHTAVEPFTPTPYDKFKLAIERRIPKTVCGSAGFPVSWSVAEYDAFDCDCEHDESDEEYEHLAEGLSMTVKCTFSDSPPEWERLLHGIRDELRAAVEGAGLKLSKSVLSFNIRERPILIPGTECISGMFRLEDGTTFDIGQHKIMYYPEDWSAPPRLVVDLIKSYC